MPQTSGHEFAVALAARRPALIERLLFVTGDTLGDLRAGVEAIGRPFIDKPLEPAELREAVARVRRQRRPRD